MVRLAGMKERQAEGQVFYPRFYAGGSETGESEANLSRRSGG